VRDETAWAAALDDVVAAHGRLDVLVNNAGVTGFEDGVEAGVVAHDPEHATLDAWRAVHATNLDGVFLGCRAALRAMRAHPPAGAGGSIVNLSSRSGLVGIPRAAAYASSKAAVRNHTKSVALYCAEEGLRVRCNSVHPAAVLTPMWDAMLGPEGPEREMRMAAFVSDTPLRRFGTPEEVAALVVYLASDESAYTTGAEFVLDGGLLAGGAPRAGGRERTTRRGLSAPAAPRRAVVCRAPRGRARTRVIRPAALPPAAGDAGEPGEPRPEERVGRRLGTWRRAAGSRRCRRAR
jgi:NAD(P)-dependent dehydrogenase (short-subunit alcohol dehydrogenase family)